MAKTTKTTQSVQTIEQKLRLILEEQIQGSGKVVSRLKEIQSALEKTNSTKKKVEISTGKVNSKLFDMGKILGGTIAKTLLWATAAAKVVSAAIAMYNAIINANRVMVRYSLLTSDAAAAMHRLRSAHDKVNEGWYNFRVSMQDVAGILADIGEKSIGARAAISGMLNNLPITDQVTKMLADLKGIPREQALGLISRIFAGENPAVVSSIINRFKNDLEGMTRALQSAGETDAANAVDEYRNKIQQTNDPLAKQVKLWDWMSRSFSNAAQKAAELGAEVINAIPTMIGYEVKVAAGGGTVQMYDVEEPSNVRQFELVKQRTSEIVSNLENMRSVATSVGQTMEYTGPTAVLIEQSQLATKELDKYVIKLKENASKMESIARKMADQSEASIYLKIAAEMRAKAESVISQKVELQLKQYETVLGLVEKEVELQKTNRQIAEATYGSAALSVKAQMNIVQALQKKKILLANELAVVQARISEEPNSLYLQKQELELRNKMKQVTAEQLQMIKELRDGYLDAVQAQAFGAGKFEKILIQQEQNIGKAMDANIAKKNFLLGKTGGVGISAVAPISFTTAGVGYLERAGELMSDEDIRKANEQAMLGVGGGAAEMSAVVTDMVIEGLDDVGNSLGSNTDALNRLSDGLNNFASRVGVMPSPATPAGQTRTSEPMRTAGAAGATLSAAGGGYFTSMARDGLNQVLKAIEGLEENSVEEYTPSRSLPSGTSPPLAL